MQRRRRGKTQPKNIFGGSTQSSQSPKSHSIRHSQPSRPKLKPIPPTLPGAKPKVATIVEVETILAEEDATTEIVDEVDDSVIVEKLIENEDIGENQNSVVEQQLLGSVQRKPIGLSRESLEPIKEDVVATPKSIVTPKSTSERARELIESSIKRASRQESIETEKAKIAKIEAVKTPPETKIVRKVPKRKFRSRTSSYQPAARAKRLDRSRHMEYKYEMRGLMSKLEIPDEHKSNLLGTIWARGERLTAKDSKEFISEKLEEGIIDENQQKALEKIVDDYTVRR